MSQSSPDKTRPQLLTPYLFRQQAGMLVCAPSPLFAGAMIGGFGAGSAFLIYLATLFLLRSGPAVANSLVGACLLLAACFSAALGLRAWRSRLTPLSIDPAGRVCYGARELAAAGTVQSVRIAPACGGEAGDAEIRLELIDGRQVSIPSQYFAVATSHEHARPFAAELAKALRVQAIATHE